MTLPSHARNPHARGPGGHSDGSGLAQTLRTLRANVALGLISQLAQAV
jgi:hypothetical protein